MLEYLQIFLQLLKPQAPLDGVFKGSKGNEVLTFHLQLL